MTLIKFALRWITKLIAALTAVIFCVLLWKGLGLILNVWLFKVVIQWAIVIPVAYSLCKLSEVCFKE